MNVTNTNWTNVINTALQNSEIEGADKIKASATADAAGNLAISFKGADGQIYNVTIAAPELDEATGKPTPEALAALETRLDAEIENAKKVFDEFKNLFEKHGINEHSTGPKKILFDIYKLMSLMLEIAQQQREAARNERKADLDRSVQDIKNQADVQREAARLGLWLGIATSAVSILAQLGTMYLSNKAADAARQMEESTGAAQFNNDLKLLTASDTAATQKNLSKIEAKFGDMAGTIVGELKSGEFKGTCEAKTNLETATTKYNGAVNARDAYVAETEKMKAELPEVEAQIEKKQQDVDSLTREVEDLTADFDEIKANFPDRNPNESQVGQDLAEKKAALETARGELKALQDTKAQTEARLDPNDPELTRLNGNVERAQAELTQAKIDFQGAADADLTRLDGELAKERIKLDEMSKDDADPKPTEAEIKEQEKKIADLEQKRAWGRAYVTDVKMKNDMKASIAADIKSCENVIGAKMETLKLDGEYRKYNSRADMMMAMGKVIEQLGTMFSNATRQGAELIGTGAAAHQAESKVHENMQQESEDLAQSAVQLLKSVLDLLRQVLEAENQSIRQIVA